MRFLSLAVIFLICLESHLAFAQGAPMQPRPLGSIPREPNALRLRTERNKMFDVVTTGEPIDNPDPRAAGFIRVDISLEARPEFPAMSSDAIVIGNVSSIQPYLSQSHGCIYSEFSVHVERIIDQSASAPKTNDIVIDEAGGAAILSSGRILRTEVVGVGSPMSTSGRYLFFLKYVPQADAYRIVKAWDLTSGKAKAMASDDLRRAATHTSAYDGMDVASFLSVAQLLRVGNEHP